MREKTVLPYKINLINKCIRNEENTKIHEDFTVMIFGEKFHANIMQTFVRKRI